MITGVTQLVIAVKDLEDAIKSYESMGLTVERRAKSENLKVDQAFLYMGDGTEIELACPFDDSSPIAKGIERNGEGLYMVSLGSDDVDGDAKSMEEKGARLIPGDGKPFIHPKTTKGVLMRLGPNKK